MNQLNIALLGFGNVGQAFVRYLEEHPQSIHVRAVADSSGGLILDSSAQLAALRSHKSDGHSVQSFAPESTDSNIHSFIHSLKGLGVSAIVESLPTNIKDGEPALGALSEALHQGLHVVTVDKGPVVHGFAALKEAAFSGNARFAFTGTTGVAIPEAIGEEKVLEIRGVLNGTTNYILTAMQEEGLSFSEALAIAQRDGIAEPDPALDVEGWDTACKILILARALMDTRTYTDANLAEVSRIGLSAETESLIAAGRKMNRLVRLVGRARIWQGRLRVSVAPKLVEPDSPFYAVNGTSKLAVFRTATQSEIVATARSGRDAISEVILEDLLKVATS
jgi:homoserine dehydrogenase